MSYDEGDGGSRQYNNNNRRGGYGGRGGGRGRGGYDKPNRRQLSPEATAVNEALAASTTWRQLNTVLEQQVCVGGGGMLGAGGGLRACSNSICSTIRSCADAVCPLSFNLDSTWTCTLFVLCPDSICVSAVPVCCVLVPCSSTHTHAGPCRATTVSPWHAWP